VKGWSYPCNRQRRSIGLWDVEDPTFSRNSSDRCRWNCQPYTSVPGMFLGSRARLVRKHICVSYSSTCLPTGISMSHVQAHASVRAYRSLIFKHMPAYKHSCVSCSSACYPAGISSSRVQAHISLRAYLCLIFKHMPARYSACLLFINNRFP
jgi:hypothetical protein